MVTIDPNKSDPHKESSPLPTEPNHQTAAGSTLAQGPTSHPAPQDANKTMNNTAVAPASGATEGQHSQEPQESGNSGFAKDQEHFATSASQTSETAAPSQSQTQQTEGQESTAAPKQASRFSVNFSGLSQTNTERAADMAEDLRKNVVNMWNAWFPTPPSAPGATASTDSGRSVSGTQSLTHHPNQPQRPAQRVNSHTVGFSAGTFFSSESASATGAQEDVSVRRSTDNMDSDSTNDYKPQRTSHDTGARAVYDANDPIGSRSSIAANVNVGPIYFMGKLYPSSPTQWADFQRDFTWGLIWCTYRHGFAPIRPSNFNSDIGWGCMLRSGQGLLANALAIQFMGRGWNRPAPGDPNWDIYVRIISWFLDDMNANFPFSVHRIALLGKQLGKNIGQWFGPSTTSQVIQALVHSFPGSGLNVYVTTDGVIYKNQVEETMARNKSGFSNLLILVTIRLGIDKLNPIYNNAIKATFEFPQTLGIAGGRPSSSYYFVGYQGNDLFYLDPHYSRHVIDVNAPLGAYTPEDLATYHCEAIRKIDINAIDPSMLLAFYCKDRSDFDAFCDQVRELNAGPGMASSIFTIGERAPEYEDDHGERLLSVADEEDEDLELIL
ncbi:hypothetical protein B0O80DRAFT_493178 [Mortierella sp. GBAus27b]|nr:Cysteine protease atg4 [Mortierella sp. GBA43]KAI8362160.1 hypothetical protein B0O80DRAFT_493178 [Mortierella sp. GBAus27b]